MQFMIQQYCATHIFVGVLVERVASSKLVDHIELSGPASTAFAVKIAFALIFGTRVSF